MERIDFQGLADEAWNRLESCLKPLLPEKEKRTGRPAVSLRKAIHTIAYQSLTNEKWSCLPKSDSFATKSVANRTLQILKKQNIDIRWICSFFQK